MADVLKPDICIIGGGAGGLAVAAAAVAFGAPTVLIERHRLGGNRLHTGDVPSQALLAAAKRAAAAGRAGTFGIAASPTVDFARVREHVQATIASLARMDSAERYAGLGVQVIKGYAKFKDRRTVTVGDQYEVCARRFVIATGSAPALPDIPGIDTGPYLTNENVFNLGELPRHLIVLGAGRVGLELAQAFRRLGSAVTVLDEAEPLVGEDAECAATVLDRLEREGIVLRTGVSIARVAHGSGRVSMVIAGEDAAIEGSHLLVATGRKPTTDGLDLEAAGVRYDASCIITDKKLKTSNGRIYAIGDVVTGAPPMTQAATYHAGLVIRHALGRQRIRVNNDLVPRVTFTEPELAQAGLTEAQAREHGIKLRIARWPYHDNDRARAERETRGHIKVITDRKGSILGATIVGVNAGELIAAWALAIGQGLNIRAFAESVLPYPTLSEIGKSAAIDFFMPSLTRPLLRRILNRLRLFG